MSRTMSLEQALAQGNPMKADPIVVAQLQSVLGKNNVGTTVMDQLCFSHDIMPSTFKWLRRDEVPYLPYLVVWPGNLHEVQEVVKIASYNRVPIIPAGGTSGTIAGIVPIQGGIIVDMKRMNRLIEVNEYNMTATVEAGMLGMDYEDQLNMRGFIGGHYPQSIKCSTVGGWIAPRGVGVWSTKYGKIEDIVQALQVVLPDGSVMETKAAPRQSCGPDLDQLFVGSEGTLGIITQATMLIWPKPENRQWAAYGFKSFEAAIKACRNIVADGYMPALMRVSDDIESAHAFIELGYPEAAGVEHVAYFGCEGNKEMVDLEIAACHEFCSAGGGISRPGFGERWYGRRFDTAVLKNAYALECGMGDAIECASNWDTLTPMHDAMLAAINEAGGPTTTVFGHGSHFYHTGGNLYIIWTSYDENELEIERKYWKIMDATMKAILSVGGAIGHHHGIGLNKGPWIHLNEPSAWEVVRKIKDTLDPYGIMNPGKMGL